MMSQRIRENFQTFENTSLSQEFSTIFCEAFANLSKFCQVFMGSRTCWDLLGPVQMCLDASGCMWMRSNAFGPFGKFWKNSFENSIFRNFGAVLEKLRQKDVTSRFLAIFCSKYTYPELSTTLGAHLEMGYHQNQTRVNLPSTRMTPNINIWSPRTAFYSALSN